MKHLPCVYTRYDGVEYVALVLAVMTLSPPATSAGGRASASGRDSVQRSDVAFVQYFNWVHGVTQKSALYAPSCDLVCFGDEIEFGFVPTTELTRPVRLVPDVLQAASERVENERLAELADMADAETQALWAAQGKAPSSRKRKANTSAQASSSAAAGPSSAASVVERDYDDTTGVYGEAGGHGTVTEGRLPTRRSTRARQHPAWMLTSDTNVLDTEDEDACFVSVTAVRKDCARVRLAGCRTPASASGRSAKRTASCAARRGGAAARAHDSDGEEDRPVPHVTQDPSGAGALPPSATVPWFYAVTVPM